MVWDDHEVANNAWREGAENHQSGEGEYDPRKRAGLQAFLEWLPIRTEQDTSTPAIYRQFAFGQLFDLIMLEQPLGQDDVVRHAALQQRMRTPICLDESILDVHRAEDMIALGSGRIINIKPGRVGGYASSIAIHDLCKANGIPVWCGGMLETGLGRAANVALAALPGFTLPGDLSASDRWFPDDLTEPFVLDGGRLTVPTGPGLGVVPIPDRLDRFTVAHRTITP